MGATTKKDGKADEEKGSKKLQGSADGVNENVGGCCQGVREFSCCRDGNQDSDKDNKSEGKKGLCNLASWCKKLDQSDFFLGAAAVGAVATVAVAYTFYRRSG